MKGLFGVALTVSLAVTACRPTAEPAVPEPETPVVTSVGTDPQQVLENHGTVGDGGTVGTTTTTASPTATTEVGPTTDQEIDTDIDLRELDDLLARLDGVLADIDMSQKEGDTEQ